MDTRAPRPCTCAGTLLYSSARPGRPRMPGKTGLAAGQRGERVTCCTTKAGAHSPCSGSCAM
ncbi:hypothetical protein L518_0938 [Bordetella bronchiseptica MBORD675]|nr:hypothetical protein L530_1219 [Bordetella bronchiseptica MO211]KAK78253.1 hypothetical protein L507_1208 [Bordetella bronchiseptica CA90 BB02]KCV28639.1 hypothetical protein L489_1339 [Bordetella bronchiseptica 00-P-2730]KDC26774.1 hypothetical protein L505_1295 [Bordetella bronchiseptica F4563]KDC94468.1 hypothetical protein L518_0938 [Bordetella bronchiseptica MBORD675]KDD99447.1 hypothetical protein L535_1248 [Bordetella bronchiseptica SBL-F6116]